MNTITPSSPAPAKMNKVSPQKLENSSTHASSATSTLTWVSNITALHPGYPTQKANKPNQAPKKTRKDISPPSSSSTLTEFTNVSALNPANSPRPPPPPSSESAANMDILYDEPVDPKARPLAWLKYREHYSVAGDRGWGVESDREEEMEEGERIRKWIEGVGVEHGDGGAEEGGEETRDGGEEEEEFSFSGLRSSSQ